MSYAYAGIGSRRTPTDVLITMTALGERLCAAGWTLRSGAADAADTAFEIGCLMACHPRPRAEIYLPWRGFRSARLGEAFSTAPPPTLDCASDDAFRIAAKYHPAWPLLKPSVRRLLARDAHQVLGRDLDDPVLMIVCWTPDGTLDGEGPDSGGTGMALRIARGEAPDTVVFNLARPEHRSRVEEFVA